MNWEKNHQYLHKNARHFFPPFFPAFFSELSLCVLNGPHLNVNCKWYYTKYVRNQTLFITVLKNANVMPVTLGFLAKIVIWDTTRVRKINLVLFANLATVMAMPTSVIPWPENVLLWSLLLLVLVDQFRRGFALMILKKLTMRNSAISILNIALSKMKLKLVNTTLQDCIVRNALKDSLVIQLKAVKMYVNPVPVHRQRISKYSLISMRQLRIFFN